MRKTFKKIVSLVVATAVAVTGVATTSVKKASAASYKAVLGYADVNWDWDGGNDSSKDTQKTAVTVKDKKGSATYTVTLKNSKSKGEAAQVFYIDIKNLLKKYKKVKVSKVSVKCDGKKVSGLKAVATGELEKKEDPGKFRISIYNRVGSKANGDKTASYPASYGNKFKFKKSISVTFTLTLK